MPAKTRHTASSPCSHAPAWEQETVSVMYAFPRRSVGTRILNLYDYNAGPRLSVHQSPSPWGRVGGVKPQAQTPAGRGASACQNPPYCFFSLFPCSRVGTRNGQRNVCIPTQERGNENLEPLRLSCWPAPVSTSITLPLGEGRRGQAAGADTGGEGCECLPKPAILGYNKMPLP